MAESQLMCMEDGLMPAPVPESGAQFYYSELHRTALEELLRNGDGAFKSLLQKDNCRDFLSARELKLITATFVKYQLEDEEEGKAESGKKREDSESLRSTYWPQMSDTEVPALDLGWPSGGPFRGVNRVSVYTHPPKDNGPHIKEVVRKLIKESGKVVAIVMDLLTDLQILQDLFEASRRGVAVYIVLDVQGAPHFLDMCNRLKVGAKDLENVRSRTVRGIGLNLSFGRIPGNIHSKYMLIDGEKVMFGTYSFSWCSSRMDRNMITVTSGQVVDFFDNDFRELYAISDKLDLFKEFHLSKPQTGTLARAAVPKRAVAATSRFQVNLGDEMRGHVPAHKYHNPKYQLALGLLPGPTSPLQEFLSSLETPLPGPQDPDENPETPTPAPSQSGTEESKKHPQKKKHWWTRWRKKKKKDKQNEGVIEELASTHTADATEDASKHTHAAEQISDAKMNDTVGKKKKGCI